MDDPPDPAEEPHPPMTWETAYMDSSRQAHDGSRRAGEKDPPHAPVFRTTTQWPAPRRPAPARSCQSQMPCRRPVQPGAADRCECGFKFTPPLRTPTRNSGAENRRRGYANIRLGLGMIMTGFLVTVSSMTSLVSLGSHPSSDRSWLRQVQEASGNAGPAMTNPPAFRNSRGDTRQLTVIRDGDTRSRRRYGIRKGAS